MIQPEDKILEADWKILLGKLSDFLGKKPDLQAILFLIGVQELGKGLLPFSKEQKTDLMHIATCKLLSQLGYYVLDGHDSEGWPVWISLMPLPNLTLREQEKMLKELVLDYFSKEVVI